MPIYEYRCEACGHVFEEWQKDFEERSCDCPDCKAEARRIISNTAFILKGSGWYVTDYARGNGSSGNGSNGAKNGTAEGAKSDSAKSEASKADSSASAGASAPASSAGKSDSGSTSA